ncbi:MAG TPA: LptA/OstA family protein [Candidatus Binatia bacterium]
MRGRCDGALLVIGVLGVFALLAWPVVAAAKKQHAAGAATAAPGTPSGPPDQMDLFQNLSLGSNKEPINITADGMELDYKGSVLTYSGNVKVVQGDATLTSDTLVITYDRTAVQASPRPGASPAGAPSPVPSSSPRASASKGGATDTDKIKQVIAEGHVRMQRGDRVAEGRHAVFDQASQTIVLSDHAVLHEGQNQVAGDRIVVYLQDQRSVVEGGSNSRVSAVFYPKTDASSSPGAVLTPHAAASPALQVGEGAH